MDMRVAGETLKQSHAHCILEAYTTDEVVYKICPQHGYIKWRKNCSPELKIYTRNVPGTSAPHILYCAHTNL
jgi:hypothetical protein